AATAASAPLRTAAAISGVVGGVAIHAGEATSPPYQPPHMAVAPNAPSNSIIGTVTSHAMTPCRIAGSARRVPIIVAATHPPTANAKNAPATLKIVVIRRTLRNVMVRGAVSWWAPIAYPMRPMMRPTASADRAPTHTALHTGQGRQPDSSSRSIVISP